MALTLEGAVREAEQQVAAAGLTTSWSNLALDLIQLALPEDERSGAEPGPIAELLFGLPLAVYSATMDVTERIQTFRVNLVLLWQEATERAEKQYSATIPESWVQLGSVWVDASEGVDLGELATDVASAYGRNVGIAVLLGLVGLVIYMKAS